MSEVHEKCLVFGASGFLGSNITTRMKQLGYGVLGTCHTNSQNKDFIPIDVLDTEKVVQLCKTINPDVIIWTILNVDLEEDIANKTISKLTKEMPQTRFIFLSTSVALVPDMDEKVVPLLRTKEMYNYHYFNGKIRAEEYIRKNSLNYVIVRPGSIYGININGEYDGRAGNLKNHIENKQEYVRAKNIIFSIVEVNELTDAIIELVESDYIGIINISEEAPISHYDFNVALCKKYGWDDSYVIGNFEKETIYYLNNDLRKKIIKTKIGNLQRYYD